MYDICGYKQTEKHPESILDGNKEPSLFGESSRSDIVSQSLSRLRELQVHRQAVLSGHFVDHSHRLDTSTARLCEMLHVSHEVFSRKNTTPYLYMFVRLAKRSKIKNTKRCCQHWWRHKAGGHTIGIVCDVLQQMEFGRDIKQLKAFPGWIQASTHNSTN